MFAPGALSVKKYCLIVGCLLLLLIFLAPIVPRLPAAAADAPLAGTLNLFDIFPSLTFESPVVIENSGDNDLYVVEQAGRIWIVKDRGVNAERSTFLDIRDRVQNGGEMGLLGLAFHPKFTENGYFYVNYTTYNGSQLVTIVSRYQLTADRDVADPQSEIILLEVRQPYSNHNGGALQFDHTGMLVIAFGDGGSAGDPDHRAQDPQSLLGKLLRIDVDRKENGNNYAIPVDNPFVGQAYREEIWALGLRNPWRFSFDRSNGDLFIGDVGQNKWEEVDYVSGVEAGGQNFGWRFKEGFACFNPQQSCDPGGLTDPIYAYGHDLGCSITGGYVYRGVNSPDLQSTYIYADYCSGRIYGLKRDKTGGWQNKLLFTADPFLSTFGEDNSGELLIAGHRSGKIYGLSLYAYRQLTPIVLH